MILETEVVEIGQFRKPHGVKGEISAGIVYPVDELSSFSTIICRIDGILVPFFIESFRTKGHGSVLLKIDGVESGQDAKKLSNQKIYALKTELPEADEVYCDYFIGYEIHDTADGLIGSIVGVDDSTANVLFVIDRDGDTVYVPVTDDLICEIDDGNRRIVMDLPEGMVSSQLN